MKNRSIELVVVALVLLCSSPVAAQSYFNDPCRTASYQAQSSQWNLSRAEVLLSRAQDAFASGQDRVDRQLANLQLSIDLAKVDIEAAKQIAAAQTTTCVVQWLFWYQYTYNCVNNSVAGGIYRQARAQAAYSAAVARKNSYAVYAEGYLRRRALQIEQAQTEYNAALSSHDAAQVRYAECRKTYPCPLSPYYGRCY
jgi:hypothetical protein